MNEEVMYVQGNYEVGTTAKAIERDTAISQMNNAQDRLHATIDELEKALELILGPDMPVSEVTGPDNPPSTFIRNSASGIAQQTERLRRLVRRIDLG